MLWHIELKFCIWLCFAVLQTKFECRQFASIFVGVMPLLELKILEIHSFPHFSLTPFNILSWKFAYYFVFLYYRSSLSVVNLRLFWSYASFRTWNTVNTVFRTFLLHALTYWAEILHMTLFYCTTGQLRVFRQWASIFVGVMSLLGLRILEIHSFSHFSPTCFDILSWNFVYHFIFMHVRSSSNAINFRHFLQELCSFLTSNSYKYALFRTFLLHALTCWVQILYMTLF